MARPASIEVAGYFPTPSSLLSRIASVVSWPGGSAHGILLDPCAGEGEAIMELRRAWAGEVRSWQSSLSVLACELEGERAGVLGGRLGHYRDRAIHGDAFRLVPTTGPGEGGGATVLFLNPPYDHDPEHGRLEHRFLVRFTEHLAAGTGLLLFLVPHGALAASASYLAAHYAELRCWRLPSPEYERFGQVLVAGRRRREPLGSAPAGAAEVLGWAREPGSLPVLPEVCADPYEVPGASAAWYRLEYELAEADLPAAAAAVEPWPGGETGGRLDARELLGARFPVAMPPKPAHIALALAAGMFNGHRLEPDEPGRFPALLAKGAYSREAVEVDRRVAEDGTQSVTTIDRPRLSVTVLRLDSYTFHTLAEGTLPEGGDDLERWTAADLLLRYGRSMAALLGRQFPALHDPARPGDRLALPALARRPFRAQDQAVQAALKLLATGRNPFFVAEVGTGKTTMALYVAAALSPAHHGATVRELRRLGLPGAVPVVRRTLVLCPPHLLGSWRDQAAAVVPEWRVRIVEGAADLEEEADLYVLSRETAKLGHGHRGLAGRCPGCGAGIETAPDVNASRRLRCEAKGRRPRNRLAVLAVELAALLARAVPGDDLVGGLAPGRLLAHCRRRGPEPLAADRIDRFRERVLGRVGELMEAPAEERHAEIYSLLSLLRSLTRASGRNLSELAGRLDGIAERAGSFVSASFLRQEARRIAGGGAADGAEPADPAGRLLGALEDLAAGARWHESGPCGEPLYQAGPPRRVPLARWILRRHRRRFDLVVVDEAHEYNDPRSAQAKAAHRLTGLPGVPALVLTGSLMGGYASSLFANFHALSARFREEFGRSEEGEFVARYGYQKVRLTLRGSEGPALRGEHTDREVGQRRVIGEAPGIHPLFLMRYLLDTAITVHKGDLDEVLPPLAEEPVALGLDEGDGRDEELVAEYRRLQSKLLERIRGDRRDPDLAGRLLGALVELPSYLDRATDDLEPFVVAYPESVGGSEIAAGKAFPRGWRTPKERWLLAELGRRVAAGERVLVFLRHSRTRLPHRLLRLVEGVAPGAVWLDASKVPAARREAWIDRHVNEPGAPVLIVNPNAVRTGLNNLVGFSTAVWYELDYSAFTYRQAIGRLHRIGQVRPVTVLIPFYPGTAQEIAFDLVARKVSASLQVDGLDVRAALEAAGAGDGAEDGLDAALSLGRAIYRELSRAA